MDRARHINERQSFASEVGGEVEGEGGKERNGREIDSSVAARKKEREWREREREERESGEREREERESGERERERTQRTPSVSSLCKISCTRRRFSCISSNESGGSSM